MRSYRDPCDRTGPAPRMWSGRYHKDHMRCIRAAKQIEAEGRNGTPAEVLLEDIFLAPPLMSPLPPPTAKRKRRSGPRTAHQEES